MEKALSLILLLPIAAWAAKNPFEGTWNVRSDPFEDLIRKFR